MTAVIDTCVIIDTLQNREPFSSRRIGADCVITRNLKDYTAADIPVYSPADFISRLTENEWHFSPVVIASCCCVKVVDKLEFIVYKTEYY